MLLLKFHYRAHSAICWYHCAYICYSFVNGTIIEYCWDSMYGRVRQSWFAMRAACLCIYHLYTWFLGVHLCDVCCLKLWTWCPR